MSLRDFFLSKNKYETLSESEINSEIEQHRNFFYAFQYFLSKQNLNKRFESFITVVFYLNTHNQNQIKDADFAKHLNCSRETVGRIRKRFDEWQRTENISLVEIVEGEYIRDLRQQKRFIYSPNSYKLTFLNLLIQAIYEATETTLYRFKPLQAIENAIDARLDLIDGNYKTQKRNTRGNRKAEDVLKTINKRISTLMTESFKIAESLPEIGAEKQADTLHELTEERLDDFIGTVKGRISPAFAERVLNAYQWSDEKQTYVKVE